MSGVKLSSAVALHDQGRRLLDRLAAFKDQLRVAFGHGFFGWPELAVGFDQTVVAALADGTVTGQRICHRPAGDSKGEAGVGPGQRVRGVARIARAQRIDQQKVPA